MKINRDINMIKIMKINYERLGKYDYKNWTHRTGAG